VSGNKFPIEIVAEDDAALRVVKRFHQRVQQLTAPLRRMQAYTAKLAHYSGMERLAKYTGKLAGAAKASAQHLAAMAAPLTAIVGGGTIAGLVTLTNTWARLNFYVERSARSAGLSTDNFQALRGVVTALGGNAEEVGASFQGFADILEGALFGRNPEALVLMNRIGLSVRRTKDGAIDTAAAFRQLSGVISHIASPEVQRLVARQFGLESMLPVLRKGPAAIDAYERKVRELGGVQSQAQLQAADKLGLALNYLKIAAGGVQNEVASKLAPGFTAFVEHLTTWLSGNRGRIGEFFKNIGDWLARIDFNKVAEGASRFLDKLGKIVDQLGGFKTIALALGGIMLANLLAPFVSLLGTMGLLVPVLAEAWPILAAIGALGLMAGGVAMTRNFMRDHPNGINVGGGHGVGARQNNPTNLRRWGLQPVLGGFAAFDSPLDGLTAAAKQLQLYSGRGIDTISGIVSTWAPAGDGNDPASYAADVARETGFDPQRHLNLHDPAVLSPLLAAIAHKESGGDYQINPGDLQQAVAAGIASGQREQRLTVTLEGLPAGVRGYFTHGSKGPVPVTIGSPMPAAGGP